MKIAILGWGSLIWDPGVLKITSAGWFEDGPCLPIEFARVSEDLRLTLVIKPGWQKVQTLYSISEFDDLANAIENLRIREKCETSGPIGYYNFTNGDSHVREAAKDSISDILAWKRTPDIDAVIWTDLQPNFKRTQGKNFTSVNACNYLQNLQEKHLIAAKQYIINAPPQIRTRFRDELQDVINKI